MKFKRTIYFLFSCHALLFVHATTAQTTSSVVRKGEKYDTIIRRHMDRPAKPKPVAHAEVVLPVPEFVNQPYYYYRDSNRLIKLETTTAQLVTKKKTLGLKGEKQFFSMSDISSKVRFTSKTGASFFIRTSGDVIDLTSYIKLYKFIPEEEKREVTITSKEGIFNDKDEGKGKQVSFSVKLVSADTYLLQIADALEAGEYGFVWVKNMDLKEFTVFAFGIDWKNSN